MEDDLKRKRKKSKKGKKHSSSSSSDEWVEKEPTTSEVASQSTKKKKKKKKKSKKQRSSSISRSPSPPKNDNKPQRDEWMNFVDLVPTSEKPKRDKEKPERSVIDDMGQTDRELNPYWKAGGSGLPTDDREKDLHVSKSAVGDRGLDWYKKALRRAEETAKAEGRSLEEVVSERWGSLDKLLSLISDASAHQSRYRRGADKGLHHRRYDKPHFRRPGDEFRKEIKNESREKNWVKKERKPIERRDAPIPPSEPQPQEKHTNIVTTKKILTDDELNALASKLLKAEILGDSKRIAQLKEELETARKARDEAVNNAALNEEETVLLLHTNEKGLTCPVRNAQSASSSSSNAQQKRKKVETHRGGERVRYFADDDKYSLQEMFQREKLTTSNDDKALFLKMTAKKGRRGGSDEEYEAFVDSARLEKTTKGEEQREMQQAVNEARRKRKVFESCNWCLDSPSRAKHLVISIGETCYLCLPEEESLTDFHCLLVPREHCTAGTLLDEDVWEEMHKFRFALWEMTKKMDADLIIFEQARALHTYPHTVFHCVVLEKEVGDLAPIYFKKAILECDSEWGHNKKLVEIKDKDVRRTIPKGLPYFAVQFGTSGGFAHVIEDEKLFKSNFAHEIIGGMLDLDHRKWRKPTKMSFPAQRQKVAKFLTQWTKYDFTKSSAKPSRDRRGRSSSSSSSSSSSNSSLSSS